MNISRNGEGIILISYLNIIAAVRAALEERIALGSSGGISVEGFLVSQPGLVIKGHSCVLAAPSMLLNS